MVDAEVPPAQQCSSSANNTTAQTTVYTPQELIENAQERIVDIETFLFKVQGANRPHNEVEGGPSQLRGSREGYFSLLEDLDKRFEQMDADPSFPPTKTTGFSLSTDTEAYILYRDCLRHLQQEYPLSSSPQSDADEASIDYRELPACFGTLVNVLADITAPKADTPDYGASIFLTHSPHSLCSLLGFLLAALVSVNKHDTLRAPDLSRTNGDDAPEARHYHALFAHYLAKCYTHERTNRLHSVVSPMPWSRKSKDALLLPVSAIFTQDAFAQPFLADENGTYAEKMQWTCPWPMDIPWMDAQHDGHPLCSTLYGYIAIRRPTGVIRSLHADAALWLSAMSFGLLEAITQVKIPEATLLVSGAADQSTVISSVRVRRFLNGWVIMQHVMSRYGGHEASDSRTRQGEEVANLLREAMEALDEELFTQSSVLARAALPESQREDIVYSVVLLIIALWDFISNHWQHIGLDTFPDSTASYRQLFSVKYRGLRLIGLETWWRNRAISAGWCPYVISGLPSGVESPVIPLMVSKLLLLKPYAMGRHASCQVDSCASHRISPGTYTVRHTQPSCHCRHIKPSLEDVMRLISAGHVPAVVYTGAELRVVPASEGTFVAISHVWAEGMGSTTEDGLPTCVVRRISGLARELLPEHSGAFWMDSLCVPNAREERKQAIRLMAKTYRDAAKVLVVDSCIRSLCSLNKSWSENMLRIATSAWIRRVWTLQEGLLARELYFEFSDGLTTATREQLTASTRSIPIPFLVPVIGFRTEHEDEELAATLTSDQMVYLVWLLRGRTTTRPEDELLAVSSLLPSRIDIGELLDQGEGPGVAGRRMRSFLLQLQKIPLFVPFGKSPRLSLYNFRWAPRALANDYMMFWAPKTTNGICTEDGLIADYVVMSSERPILLSRPVTILRYPTSTTTYYGLSLSDAEGYSSCLFDTLIFPDEENSPSGCDDPMFPCIAAKMDCPPGSGGVLPTGDGGQSPLRCMAYVARCQVIPFPVHFKPANSDIYDMLNLGTVTVQLK
ncbi:hypothetical protein C8Q70DRAFT_124425 [Cubamyces menziesii]|nr:hypothetical protein C8Q70DRAFT_124425 [Cubamyces menziesii]